MLHIWGRKKKKNIITNFTKEERKSLDDYSYVSVYLENVIKGGITQYLNKRSLLEKGDTAFMK